MAKTTSTTCSNLLLVSLLVLVLGACSTSKSKYQKEYSRVWKEIINSEAWKNSLLANVPEPISNETELYASTSGEVINEDGYTDVLGHGGGLQ